jgi:Plasmid pRiA4b ORF-3-like protein
LESRRTRNESGSVVRVTRRGKADDPLAGLGLPEDVMRQLMAAMSGKSLDEMERMLLDLMAAVVPKADPFARAAPPSCRRPRRSGVMTYRVRVDLKDTRPSLWRRLELSSDLFLDEVHRVIQRAFGWTDSHLHQFAFGPDPYDPQTEQYLCPYQVEEGETGVPEEQVRLDEVLAGAGDKLCYVYDFGDDWRHVIKLEAITARQDGSPRAVCTGGRRDGPAEDCGGAGAFELIAEATDPANPDYVDAVAEFARIFGDDVDPGAIGTSRFDLDQISATLAAEFPAGTLSGGRRSEAGGSAWAANLPEPLGELVAAVGDPAARRDLRRLLDAALDQSVLIDAETASRMVRPYSWLLDRVGADGIKLTAAGHLPPAHVEAAVAGLGLDEDWIGKGNRETQTVPVLHLRETATKMGLLRKHREMLLVTSRGRELRGNPAGLWWHLAERMPPKTGRCEVQAGLLLLAAVAAQVPSNADAVMARMLGAIGWIAGDGTEFTRQMARRAAWDTWTVLRRLGGYSHDRHGLGLGQPTPEGITFARAALRTWPS